MTFDGPAPARVRSRQRTIDLLFVFLCLLHFFSQRPLWLDEISVCRNIQELSYGQILGPLNYSQAFPRLYLIVIKFLHSYFDHVLILRLLPLLAMLGAYAVWKKIYRSVFGLTWQGTLALFSFACSYAMSYYAAELKPYSMDVLTAGLFTLYVLGQKNLESGIPRARDYFVAGTLPFLMLFSYGGLFFFLWPLWNFVFIPPTEACKAGEWSSGRDGAAQTPIPRFQRGIGVNRRGSGHATHMSAWGSIIRRQGKGRLCLLYLGLSAGVIVFLYNLDLRFTAQDHDLRAYWDSYHICVQTWACFWSSLGEGFQRLITWAFGKGDVFKSWATFVVPFFLYAFIRYGALGWVKSRGRIFSVPVVGTAVLALLFVLSVFKVFPFTGERITLFFCPFVYLLAVRGIWDLKRLRISHRVAGFLFYFFAANYLIFLVTSAINTIIIYIESYQS